MFYASALRDQFFLRESIWLSIYVLMVLYFASFFFMPFHGSGLGWKEIINFDLCTTFSIKKLPGILLWEILVHFGIEFGKLFFSVSLSLHTIEEGMQLFPIVDFRGLDYWFNSCYSDPSCRFVHPSNTI